MIRRCYVGNIEHFKRGGNIRHYLERMEQLILVNYVPQSLQVPFIVALCGPEFYKLIRAVAAPRTADEITFEELKRGFENLV